MSAKYGIFLSFFYLLLLSGCVKTEKEVRYLPAPGKISESFSKSDTCQKVFCIDLKKESLNKKFLLVSTAKTSSTVPQWEDFKPYTVIFQKQGRQVAMLAMAPLTVLEQNNQFELLQTFDVLDEAEDIITIDWSKGFGTIRFESNYENDGPQMEDRPSNRTSAQVVDAFVRKVQIQDDFVEIEQNSKLLYSVIKNRRADFFEKESPRLPDFETQETSLLANIRLYPDIDRVGFEVKTADSERNFGYFTYGKAVEGFADIENRMIMKWDIDPTRGPITYYVTSQIPPEYVDSVKLGVLYWNKVFGKDVFNVVTGVDSNFIPPLHSVVIRWLPWEDAGFAYANIQAHPMTGEILRGQIYMTSAFTQTDGFKERLNPIFKPMARCHLSPKGKHLKEIKSRNRFDRDPIDQKLAQDGVAETIAHEVGHTIGLRHNFAASFSAKPDNFKMFEEVKKYLAGETIQGFESISSVMDYVGGAQEVVMANYIKHSPLTYDKLAVNWGYLSQQTSSADVIKKQSEEVQRNFAYCDDDDLGMAEYRDKKNIFECNQFDPAGNYFIAYTHSHLKYRNQILQEHFESLAGAILLQKKGFDLERYLSNQEIKPELENLSEILQVSSSKSKYVSQRFFNEVLGRGYKKGEDKEIKKIVGEQLEQAGGIAKMNTWLCPSSNSWLLEQLTKVLEQIEAGEGTTPNGIEYSLTEGQKVILHAYFQTQTEAFEKSYLEAIKALGLCQTN